jgi:ankyrin repeat protein
MKEINLFLLIFFALMSSLNVSAFDSSIKKMLDLDKVDNLRVLSQEKIGGESRDRAGRTPLLYAVQYKKNKALRYLISRKLGVNSVDYLGRTPILVALGNNSSKDVIELLLENDADLRVKDKNSRDLYYYISKHKDLNVRKLVSEKLKNLGEVSKKEVLELKEALTSGSVEVLENHITKYKSLNIDLGNLSTAQFLVEMNLLSKWSIDYLASKGLNFFIKDLPHNVLKKKQFSSFNQLLKYKLNVGLNSHREPLLSIALKNNANDQIIESIIKRLSKFTDLDDQRNNYLHLAYKYKRIRIAKILKSKGVSLTVLNEKGETPYMILINNSSNQEEVLLEIKDDVKPLSIIGQSNTNSVILLSRKFPEVFKEIVQSLKDENYDFSYTDENGNSAASLYLTTVDQVDLNEVEENLANFNPELEGVKEEVILEDESVLNSENIQDLDQELYLGDRMFDDFIKSKLDLYILNIREQFRAYVTKRNQLGVSSETQKLLERKASLDKKLIEFKKEVSIITENVKGLKKSHLDLRGRIDSFDLSDFSSRRTTVHEKMKNNLSSLISYMNYVDEDLTEFYNKKNELEAIIKIFKNGKDEISSEILNLRSEFSRVREEVRVQVKDLEVQHKVDLEDLISIVEDSKDRVNHDRRILDEVDSKIQSIKKSITRLNNIVTRNRRLENHNGHDPVTCKFTERREKAQKDIKRIGKNLTNVQKERKSRLRKYEFSTKRLNESKNRLAKVKSAQSKLMEKFKKELERISFVKESEIKSKINQLEAQREVDKDEVLVDSQILLESIESRYGDVETISSDWNKMREYVGNINNIKTLKNSFGCLLNLCTPSLVLQSDSKLSNEFNRLASELAFSFGNYSQVAFGNSIYSNIASSLKELEVEFEKSSARLDELSLLVLETTSDIKKIGVDIVSSSNSENSDLDEFINLEELKFRAEVLSDKKFSDERLDELRSSFLSSDNKEVSSFVKNSPVESAEVSFNSISYHNDIRTLKSYSKKEKAYVLKQWVIRLLEKNKDFWGSFYSSSSVNVFVESLITNVEVELVSDGSEQTILILTDHGQFLIDENGLSSEVSKDKESPFDFDLVSTGEVRKRIVDLISKFKNIYPDVTLRDLSKDQNLSIVVALLKTADKLNDIKKTKEILDIVEAVVSPLMLLAPGGQVLLPTLGIARCAFDIFQKVNNDLHDSNMGNMNSALKCMSDLFLFSGQFSKYGQVLSTAIDNTIPSKLLARYISNFFKHSSSSTGLEMFKVFLEGTFSLSIEDIDESLFVENGNVFKSIYAGYDFSTNYVDFVEKDLLNIGQQNFNVSKQIVKNEISVSAYGLNDRYIIYNVCQRSKQNIKNILKNDLNILVKSFKSKSVNQLKKDEVIYNFNEEPCLFIKEHL